MEGEKPEESERGKKRAIRMRTESGKSAVEELTEEDNQLSEDEVLDWDVSGTVRDGHNEGLQVLRLVERERARARGVSNSTTHGAQEREDARQRWCTLRRSPPRKAMKISQCSARRNAAGEAHLRQHN